MAPMGRVRPRVSYADLERWPEDGRRYELYDGEVRVVPSPLPLHQVVAFRLAELLSDFAAARGGLMLMSPVDIIFSEHDVIQPDVVFFQASRRHLVRLDAPIRHHPDIAVEVLSPSTRGIDRGQKMELFARYGVPEYWIVDPAERHIEVHALEGDAYRVAQIASGAEVVRSVVLPELVFVAAMVFPDGQPARTTPSASSSCTRSSSCGGTAPRSTDSL